MIPKDIHKIAQKMSISWDGDANFMNWCKQLVGKRHLDDMDESELITVYGKIKNGEYNNTLSEKWSVKYKKSINCSNPKGFSQKAHCAGKKKRKKMYKEVEDANYIMRMMEDVFGHRVTVWTPKDTTRLKKKLSQPISDKEREQHVADVEPRMDKKSIVPKKKNKSLDSFIDLDTRISQKDYEPTIDLDTYKKVRVPLKFKSPEEKGGETEGGAEEKETAK